MTDTRRAAGGFTLIEVAVVIAIIGALLGTLLVPLATQIEASKVKATDRSMDAILEALLGHAMAEGSLPCPDFTGDGIEDRAGGAGTACSDNNAATDPDLEGFLPHSTLGVGSADAWGRRFLYRVDAEFTYAAVAGSAPPVANRLDLQDVGTLDVFTRTDDPTTVGVLETRFLEQLADGAPAVVLSYGPNGYGATTTANTVVTDPAGALVATRDEHENRDADTTFMFRTRTVEGTACDDTDGSGPPFCIFDDRVAWLSRNLLFNRLVTAGVLP